MASEAGSSDFNDLGLLYFERLNLSDCAGARRKLQFTPRRASSANNAFQSSPHSDESSTTCSQSDSKFTCIKYRKKPGFVSKMPCMGIFWDIENVGVPKQKSAAAIVQKIRSVFLKDYRESEFMVVCDVKKEQPLLMQELHDSQVNLIHVSSTSKNAADDKLRQLLRRFADVHPAPSAILLITGDINFAADLYDLRYRKKIRIILVHNVNISDALILSANDHYLFTNLIQRVPSSSQRKIANSHTFLTILNLPKNIDQRKVKNRLRFLTNNCGGKCVEFLSKEGVACLRFGNFDLALRSVIDIANMPD